MMEQEAGILAQDFTCGGPRSASGARLGVAAARELGGKLRPEWLILRKKRAFLAAKSGFYIIEITGNY
jgi:hypothetical protein